MIDLSTLTPPQVLLAGIMLGYAVCDKIDLLSLLILLAIFGVVQC